MERSTDAWLRLRPAFSPPDTLDASPLSVMANQTSAESPAESGGSLPTLTAKCGSLGLPPAVAAMVTGAEGTAPEACAAFIASSARLPTNPERPFTTICGVYGPSRRKTLAYTCCRTVHSFEENGSTQPCWSQ